jgi:hypothetical protein
MEEVRRSVCIVCAGGTCEDAREAAASDDQSSERAKEPTDCAHETAPSCCKLSTSPDGVARPTTSPCASRFSWASPDTSLCTSL